MNEVAEQEVTMLESIYNDTFQRLDEETIRIVCTSSRYKCDIEFVVRYSKNYPSEPNRIDVASYQLHKQYYSYIVAYVAYSYMQLLNDAQGFMYQLICEIDEEELYYEASQSSEKNEETVEETNHGMIPGRPCTEALFQQWFAEYVYRKNITLLEEDTWYHALYPQQTGYEIWEAKRNEQVIEE